VCGKEFRVKPCVVLRGHGLYCSLACRHADMRRDIVHVDIDYLYHEYVVCERDFEDLSRELGCSSGTLRRRAVSAGFHIRNKSESRIGSKNPMYGMCGHLNPFYGKRHSPDTIKRLSEFRKGLLSGPRHPMYGKHLCASTREKMRVNHADFRGPNHPNWKGGISFEPYCTAFNDDLKERVREKFGRRCFLCGKPENESRRKLCVHHVDYNKGQGCGHEWNLVPLCNSCHIKTNYNRWYWFNLLCCYWLADPDINFHLVIMHIDIPRLRQ